MAGIEFLLFAILHTDRTASHGHDVVIERHETKKECLTAGQFTTKKDKRDHFVCVPVVALPDK